LIIAAWQHISPEVTVKGFKKCCTSIAVDGTDDKSWNGSERIGMLGVSVEKMKAWKVETLTLIGEDRKNLTCFVH